MGLDEGDRQVAAFTASSDDHLVLVSSFCYLMDSKRLAAPISASDRLDCPQAAGRERLLMADPGPSRDSR